jgi:hypothetical protein
MSALQSFWMALGKACSWMGSRKIWVVMPRGWALAKAVGFRVGHEFGWIMMLLDHLVDEVSQITLKSNNYRIEPHCCSNMILGSCVVARSTIPSKVLRLLGGLLRHVLQCVLDGRSTELVDGFWERKLVDGLL